MTAVIQSTAQMDVSDLGNLLPHADLAEPSSCYDAADIRTPEIRGAAPMCQQGY